MHPSSSPVTLGRCLAVAGVATLLVAGVLGLTAPPLGDALAQWRGEARRAAAFVDLLVWWCALVGALVATWLWLASLLVVGAALRGRPHARPALGLPAWGRRLVLSGCGVALATTATPALALDPGATGADPESTWADGVVGALEGLPLPDRAEGGRVQVADAPSTVGGPLKGAGTGPRTGPGTGPGTGVVIVRPGDSLWVIARRDLGVDAAEQAVDARWRALWARNGAVVGPDPDLLFPGQRLVLPPSGTDYR